MIISQLKISFVLDLSLELDFISVLDLSLEDQKDFIEFFAKIMTVFFSYWYKCALLWAYLYAQTLQAALSVYLHPSLREKTWLLLCQCHNLLDVRDGIENANRTLSSKCSCITSAKDLVSIFSFRSHQAPTNVLMLILVLFGARLWLSSFNRTFSVSSWFPVRKEGQGREG